jgi:hypothetical protein
MKRSLVFCLLLWSVASRAQMADTATPYRIETHFDVGPLVSAWIYGPRFPTNASRVTLGYSATARIMWHPDHLLAVGLYTGYEEIVAEEYQIANSLAFGKVSGALRRIPFMIDESMQQHGFELGVALGGYLLETTLKDEGTTRSSHFELGVVGHAGYHWQITHNLLLGTELSLGLLSFRGILSFAPNIALQYNPYRY